MSHRLTMIAFVKEHVSPGSTVHTDGLKGCEDVEAAPIGNLQPWRIGTYHGVSHAQLQVHLDEFVFRHNRRRQPMAALHTRLGLGTGRAPTPYRQIRGARDVAAHSDRNLLGVC